jgi:hypothetical protein
MVYWCFLPGRFLPIFGIIYNTRDQTQIQSSGRFWSPHLCMERPCVKTWVVHNKLYLLSRPSRIAVARAIRLFYGTTIIEKARWLRATSCFGSIDQCTAERTREFLKPSRPIAPSRLGRRAIALWRETMMSSGTSDSAQPQPLLFSLTTRAASSNKHAFWDLECLPADLHLCSSVVERCYELATDNARPTWWAAEPAKGEERFPQIPPPWGLYFKFLSGTYAVFHHCYRYFVGYPLWSGCCTWAKKLSKRPHYIYGCIVSMHQCDDNHW